MRRSTGVEIREVFGDRGSQCCRTHLPGIMINYSSHSSYSQDACVTARKVFAERTVKHTHCIVEDVRRVPVLNFSSAQSFCGAMVVVDATWLSTVRGVRLGNSALEARGDMIPHPEAILVAEFPKGLQGKLKGSLRNP